MRVIRVPAYIIKQFERGIVEHFGQYRRFVEPGIHFQLPFINITRVRDVREHTMDIHPQPVITKDTVEIMVDGRCCLASWPYVASALLCQAGGRRRVLHLSGH